MMKTEYSMQSLGGAGSCRPTSGRRETTPPNFSPFAIFAPLVFKHSGEEGSEQKIAKEAKFPGRQEPTPPKSNIKRPASSVAFTLIELLVVIAIIAILIIILWAAVKNAIADAKRKTAQAEMHEIVSAVTGYYQEYEKLPIPDADQDPPAEESKYYSGATAGSVYQALTGANPRGRVFLNREMTGANDFLKDPWNISYVLCFDRDYSGSTTFYNCTTNIASGKTSRSGRVVVRSYGPNKRADDVSYSTCDDIVVD